MPRAQVLVTGATGLAGRYAARRLLDAGYSVRALVRRDAHWLERLGVSIMHGDLERPETLDAAMVGVDIVVHAAAMVGDWGPLDAYRPVNVFALEHLLTAAHHEQRLRRWVQISSLGVYPAKDHHGTTEDIGIDLRGLDGYTRTKAEAEVVLQRHMQRFGLPGVILRPGFMYGRGDRHVVPPLVERIQRGTMRLIGDGEKVLNNTYAGNLADAIILAIENDNAIGQTFNIHDGRLVTRRELLHTIADLLARPRPKRASERLIKLLAGPVEWSARVRRAPSPPLLTRGRVKFLTQNLDFSIEKARHILGYNPRYDFREAIGESLQVSEEGRHTPGVA